MNPVRFLVQVECNYCDVTAQITVEPARKELLSDGGYPYSGPGETPERRFDSHDVLYLDPQDVDSTVGEKLGWVNVGYDGGRMCHACVKSRNSP